MGNHYVIGQDVGLRGTPAIVLEDGTLFSGYLEPDQLQQAIAQILQSFSVFLAPHLVHVHPLEPVR